MVHIRDAEDRDAEAIAALLAQLGYPSAALDVRDRVRTLQASPQIRVLVAEFNDTVVGLATFHLFDVLHEPKPRGQLTALVVADSARRKGIGQGLVKFVEEIAAGHGVTRLMVTTGNARADAHAFYERLGYEWTGRRYLQGNKH